MRREERREGRETGRKWRERKRETMTSVRGLWEAGGWLQGEFSLTHRHSPTFQMAKVFPCKVYTTYFARLTSIPRQNWHHQSKYFQRYRFLLFPEAGHLRGLLPSEIGVSGSALYIPHLKIQLLHKWKRFTMVLKSWGFGFIRIAKS